MNPSVSTAGLTMCRGVCLATTGFSLTVSLPAVAVTLGMIALSGLAAFTLSRSRSSVRIAHDITSIELRHD